MARAVVPVRIAPEARQAPGTTEGQAQAVGLTMALVVVVVRQVLAGTAPRARLGDRAGLRTRGLTQPCMAAVVVAQTQRRAPTVLAVRVSAAMAEASITERAGPQAQLIPDLVVVVVVAERATAGVAVQAS